MSTLIQYHEVAKLARIRGTFPVCELQDIEIIEYKIFKDCLGLDFYNDLIADLADHATAEDYDDANAYAIGDKAIFDQYIYEAIAVTTGNRPDNIKYWKNATKFVDANFESLWCKYLGPYVAFHIQKHTITPSSIYMSPQGAARRSGENFSPASTSEINMLVQNIDSKITMTLDVMIDYMTKQKENDIAVFDNYKGFLDGCETGSCLDSRALKTRYRVG